MGKTRKRKLWIIPVIVIVLLVAVLSGLLAYLITLFNLSESRDNLKSLGIGLESEHADYTEDYNDLVLPEFIGVTVSGKRRGVIGEKNIMSDVYRGICGYLSDYIDPESSHPSDYSRWREYADSGESLYIRYHAELPDFLIASLADLYSGTVKSRNSLGAYIYEMFILPGKLESGATSLIAVRDYTGNVYEYSVSENAGKVTSDVFLSFTASYSSAFRPFVFAYEVYSDMDQTIPVINGNITTRNIITTNDTASMLRSSRSECRTLMGIFDMNPDKLLSTRQDVVFSYSDRRGVLSLGDSVIEFRSTEDGGPDVYDLTGQDGDGTIYSYISAVVAIKENIEKIGKHYTGGDADMFISSASFSKGTLSITMSYSYDNIPIVTEEPACEIVFSYGKLRSARIYTISARSIGTRYTPPSEWWFIDVTSDGAHDLADVFPVYKADYVSESIKAEWAYRISGTSD